jgi:hypothetical protein
VETHVEDLQQGQRAEGRPEQRRRGLPGPARHGEQHGDAEQCLRRDAQEGTRRDPGDLVRQEQSGEHDHGGQPGERAAGDGTARVRPGRWRCADDERQPMSSCAPAGSDPGKAHGRSGHRVHGPHVLRAGNVHLTGGAMPW